MTNLSDLLSVSPQWFHMAQTSHSLTARSTTGTQDACHRADRRMSRSGQLQEQL